MMTGSMPVISLYKPVGVTPLQMIERLREERPEWKDETMSYAGRLDPMAEGLLLILVGEENKKREEYLDLDKEYAFEVLVGFSTDSGDLLGMVDHVAVGKLDKQKLIEVASEFQGEVELPYPAFSAKTVEGKPLWQWQREGGLVDRKLPMRKVVIYDLNCESRRVISSETLHDYIGLYVPKIRGDFRQEQIMKQWREKLDKKDKEYEMYTFVMHCSSGTYVRAIVMQMSELVDHPLTTFSIKRLRVGSYSLRQTVRL